MPDEIDKAVVALWDADGLTSAVSVLRDEAPERTALPYAVGPTQISNVPTIWSTDSEYRAQQFQIQMWADTRAQASSLLKSVTDVFDDAVLSLTAARGVVLKVRRDSSLILREGKRLWQAVVTYTADRQLDRVTH